MHYGDPYDGCLSDEYELSAQGFSGDWCGASCTYSDCPTDEPEGMTGDPQCALQNQQGEKFCALICDPAYDDCGKYAHAVFTAGELSNTDYRLPTNNL